MAKGNTVEIDPSVGWALDNRGYVHGISDPLTPLFDKAKTIYNTRLTQERASKRQEAKIKRTLANVKLSGV